MRASGTYGFAETGINTGGSLLLLFVFCSLTGQVPEPFLPVSPLIEAYQREIPNDYMLLQTDRDMYFSGEAIWFSGWTLDDLTARPVNRHRAAYLELINAQNQPVVQQVVSLSQGKMVGRLELPLDIPSGTYSLRAYTAWHKQFGPQLFALRLVQIINPYLPPRNLKPEDPYPRCKVFPEGGLFLEGIANRGVVEVRNERGSYLEFLPGVIVNEKGDTVTRIKRVTKGIGSFNLRPEPGSTYQIRIDACEPVRITTEKRGAHIGVTETHHNFVIRWDTRKLQEKYPLYLIGLNEGKLFLEKQLESILPGDQVLLRKEDLPPGLLEILILDRDLTSLSSRLVFNHLKTKSSPLKISCDQLSYHPGDTIKLTIASSDFRQLSTLSVKVVNDLFSLPDASSDPTLNLHLNSQLNDWDDFRQLAQHAELGSDNNILDLYLVTRKPVRHSWDRIRNLFSFSFREPAESDFRILHGEASASLQETPLREKDLHVYLTTQGPKLLQTTTDSAGRFQLILPLDSHEKQLMQFQSPLQKHDLVVRMDDAYYPEYFPYHLNFYFFDSLRIKDYDRAFVNWQINMLHREHLYAPSRVVPEWPLPSFYESAKNRYFLDDYITFLNMEEVFKEIIGNVKVRGHAAETVFEVYDMVTNTVLGDAPLVLFNGQPVEKVSDILAIPEKEIEFVDVVPRRFFVGRYSYDGIIHVVAWNRNRQVAVPRHNYRTVLEGTDTARGFRLPGSRHQASSTIPDLRNTLYWNPSVSIPGGQKMLTFRAGGDTGTYDITVTGLYHTGETFRVKHRIQVE